MNLEDIASKIISNKKEQKKLDEEYKKLQEEFIKYYGDKSSPYKHDGVTISLISDIQYEKFDFELLRNVLKEYLSEKIIQEIIEKSQREVSKNGGIRVIINE